MGIGAQAMRWSETVLASRCTGTAHTHCGNTPVIHMSALVQRRGSHLMESAGIFLRTMKRNSSYLKIRLRCLQKKWQTDAGFLHLKVRIGRNMSTYLTRSPWSTEGQLAAVKERRVRTRA